MRRSRALLPILLLLAVISLQGACPPHTHSAQGIGLFNQEHDLTLLATAGTAASLPVVMLLFVATVFVSLCIVIRPTRIVVTSRDAESRAPPA